MITKTVKSQTPKSAITANTAITSGVRNRRAPAPMKQSAILANVQLTREQQAFVNQLKMNLRRNSVITAATNTSNIMAKPEFLELLPLFVQKLLILDIFGSVAMKSRQQLIPYFKFVAENTKGVTKAGDVLSSPFVNRQGVDPNFTGRIIKNEAVNNDTLAYCPILPGSVTLQVDVSGTVTKYVDNAAGDLIAAGSTTSAGNINYSTGAFTLTGVTADAITATYQYDNENVGPRGSSNGSFGYDYGAQMGKGYLQLDEINLIAEAHELACYWSIYSAFAAQKEYGSNIADIAKEAAFSELTAEINTKGFQALEHAASYNPQFNWDASPVLSGSVVPTDYLKMFKLKLNQAAAAIYQKTRLTRPNRMTVGSNVAAYIGMIEGFKAAPAAETVGPYYLGDLDQMKIYVSPDQDPDKWVMSCKSNDIRRNSALFGEYMPLTNTDAIGLANASVQQGYASMYAMKVVNPDTVVSGRITGTF